MRQNEKMQERQRRKCRERVRRYRAKKKSEAVEKAREKARAAQNISSTSDESPFEEENDVEDVREDQDCINKDQPVLPTYYVVPGQHPHVHNQVDGLGEQQQQQEEQRSHDTVQVEEANPQKSVDYSETKGNQIVSLNEVDEIVKGLTSIVFRHEVSDSAIEEMFKFFCNQSSSIASLMERGKMRPSWRNFARPRALLHCPNVKCAYVVERAFAGEVTQIIEQDLDCIPAEILSLPHDGPRRLLRTEASVNLKEIKDLHIKIHPNVKREQMRKDLLHCQVSVDGVREAKKGTRTLTIVSVRIGDCIYLHGVVQTLIGIPLADPVRRNC